MSEFLRTITTHDSLFAIGVSLVMLGLVLRTFARSRRRAVALRQQHRLHDRKLGEAIVTEETDESTSWFEKHISAIANIVVGAGLVITVLSAFRK